MGAPTANRHKPAHAQRQLQLWGLGDGHGGVGNTQTWAWGWGSWGRRGGVNQILSSAELGSRR